MRAIRVLAGKGLTNRSSHAYIVHAGSEVTVLVTEIDERGRIRLSRTQAEAADERREASEYMAKAPRASGKGFGTLGDLLKSKLR